MDAELGQVEYYQVYVVIITVSFERRNSFPLTSLMELDYGP